MISFKKYFVQDTKVRWKEKKKKKKKKVLLFLINNKKWNVFV